MTNLTESKTNVDEHFTDYSNSSYFVSLNDTIERYNYLCGELYKNFTSELSGKYEYCSASSDSVLCWPPTLVNNTATQKCFSSYNNIKYDDTQNATRDCLPNGLWSRTNYSNCLEIVEKNPPISTPATIYSVGYLISLVTLSVAIGIFIYFKDLKCLRNTIHTNLMFAYICVYLLWIITLFIENNFETNTLACIILIILLHYFHLTTFFWMFVEGLYLYILVVKTLTRENFKFRVYACIGWGVPAIIITIWAVMKSVLEFNKETNSEEEAMALTIWINCPWWVDNPIDWVYKGPTVAILLLNLVFLCAIMWVLITKLRSANTLETQQYRKAAKALVVLKPLLGVTYILTITVPSTEQLMYIFDYMRAVLLSTQGFTVALFYCFLNTEVQNTLRHHIETWKTSRSLGQRKHRLGSRSKDWSPRSRTESIRLYSQPIYNKRESSVSEVTTTTLVTVNGGASRSSNGGGQIRSPFLQPPKQSFHGNV